jgi:hypothetical protein
MPPDHRPGTPGNSPRAYRLRCEAVEPKLRGPKKGPKELEMFRMTAAAGIIEPNVNAKVRKGFTPSLLCPSPSTTDEGGGWGWGGPPPAAAAEWACPPVLRAAAAALVFFSTR